MVWPPEPLSGQELKTQLCLWGQRQRWPLPMSCGHQPKTAGWALAKSNWSLAWGCWTGTGQLQLLSGCQLLLAELANPSWSSLEQC